MDDLNNSEDREKFAAEFLAGQRDCREGVPHTDKSEAYNRGYATEYESEQIKSRRPK